jgi:hypothetical protein
VLTELLELNEMAALAYVRVKRIQRLHRGHAIRRHADLAERRHAEVDERVSKRCAAEAAGGQRDRWAPNLSGRAVRADVCLGGVQLHLTRPGAPAFQTTKCLPSRPYKNPLEAERSFRDLKGILWRTCWRT